jgi:hypothetical protein
MQGHGRFVFMEPTNSCLPSATRLSIAVYKGVSVSRRPGVKNNISRGGDEMEGCLIPREDGGRGRREAVRGFVLPGDPVNFSKRAASARCARASVILSLSSSSELADCPAARSRTGPGLSKPPAPSAGTTGKIAPDRPSAPANAVMRRASANNISCIHSL